MAENTVTLTEAELNLKLAQNLQDGLKAFIKDTGMTLVDQKYLVHPDVKNEKEHLEKTKTEQFGTLVKAIWNRDYVKVQEIKAADPNNMTTDADGGYLVPDVTEAKIIGLIPTFGQARQYLRVDPFPKSVDNMTVPKRSTGVTVYYPGEQGSITSSKLALTYLTLATKKAAGLVVLTNELKEFAAVDFVNYINVRAAEAFAQDEDSKVFGTGNTTFTGLFYKSNSFGKSVEVTSADSITYRNLLEIVYGLDPKYYIGAAWYMNRTMIEKVRGIVDEMGRPVFIDANAASLPTLLGFPVRSIETAPASTVSTAGQPLILFGNLAYSYMFEKSGMRIDMSTEGYVDATSLFQTDMSALRFIRHWGFHPGLVEGYAVIKIAD